MSTTEDRVQPTTLHNVPIHRVLPRLLKDPIAEMERIAESSHGQITRLNLGPFRPYLLTHPDHVQHVLVDNRHNFVRDGMFWKPIRRLTGDGIIGFGAKWHTSRQILRPLFTARHVHSMMADMIDAVMEGVEVFEDYARTGETVDAKVEMTRIVHSVTNRVLFGDRITIDDLNELAPAIETAANSLNWRMLMPFVPHSIPMPGDRAFRRSIATTRRILLPLIGTAQEQDQSTDVVSTLCHARYDDGSRLSDQQICDDVVGLFGAGTETTAMSLVWLCLALKEYPQVADGLYDEIDRVVGTGRISPEHLSQLHYTRMVLDELTRMYASVWVIPRQCIADDVIDDVPIRAGSTILISPYLTHRMSWLWDRPYVFDPHRFDPQQPQRRHRFAYFPFGGGPHKCLGQQVFMAEAQIILAAVLSRYRPVILNHGPATAKPAATLQPRQRIDIVVHPKATG